MLVYIKPTLLLLWDDTIIGFFYDFLAYILLAILIPEKRHA